MAVMGELEKYVTELSEKTRADGEFTVRNTVEKVLREFASKIDNTQFMSVYYWHGNVDDYNHLYSILAHGRYGCVLHSDGQHLTNGMTFPVLIVNGEQDRWNKNFTAIDSKGISFAGYMDMRNGNITCNPASYSILSSPNGTAYKITVSNDGELTTTALT